MNLKLNLKIFSLIVGVFLEASEVKLPFVDEKNINLRINESSNSINYSTRIKLFEQNNISFGWILYYEYNPFLNQNQETQSKIYLQYKF